MLKRIAAIILLLFLGLFIVGYLCGVSLRQAGIIEGRMMLKIAAKDLAEYGYVTNVFSSSYRFWLSTNVVAIGGTQYQYYAEVGGGEFSDDGTLAITTNQTFIWLDRKYPPKIIGTNYRVPLFPPRF
jgi:hypothetical protein